MSWEHAAEARAALNAIVTDPDYGVAALSSPRTMSSLLKDLLPDAPREKVILVAAAEAGLADTLRQHVYQGMDTNTAIRLSASSFSSTTPFTPEACIWVTNEIATALGIRRGSGVPLGFYAGQSMPTQVAPVPGYPPRQQPTQGFGYGQASGYGYGQPGYGYAQPDGYGYGQQGGYGIQQPARHGPAVPTAAMGPMGPYGPNPGGPGGPGGPLKPRRSRHGWLIGGSIVAVIIVAAVVAVGLSRGGAAKTPTAATPRSTQPNPSPSLSLTHPPGTDALATIMNLTGAGARPLGTECVTAKLFGLNPETLDARIFCHHTTAANMVVWGYQFDNSADYRAGLAHINHYVGFDQVKPGIRCPPPSGSVAGKDGWHTIHNPKYHAFRRGQNVECLIDAHKPVIIWTMPTQDVFFIGQDNVEGTAIKTVMKWWRTLTYGP
jgi:hypothetical protein